MKPIDNIQTLYSQLNDTKKFIQLVADDLKKKPLSLQNNWFRNFWAIPTQYEYRVIQLLQRTIKNQ